MEDRLSLNVQPVKIHTKQRISSLISRSHSVIDFLRQGVMGRGGVPGSLMTE